MIDNVLGQAILRLNLDSKGLTQGATKVNSTLKTMTQTVISSALGFGGAMGLASMLQRTTQAFVGNTKELVEYQKSMAEVSTLVDTTKVNMDELTIGVDRLSSKWGIQQGGLAKALYQTISASIDTEKSVKFLDAAIKASIGGVTTAKVAVDGLTSVINAYGKSAEDAETLSDSFFVAVRDGKTTFEELSSGIGGVISMAAALDVNLETLLSTVATLTLSGMSTDKAYTGVRGIFSAILKQAPQVTEYAKMLGIDFSASAVKSKGFVTFLNEVMNKTAGSEAALAKLIPELVGLNSIMGLTSESGAKNLNRILGDMENQLGETTKAADKMTDILSHKWDRAMQNAKLRAQEFGKALTPLAENILDTFNIISEVEAARKKLSVAEKMFYNKPQKMDIGQLEEMINLARVWQKELERRASQPGLSGYTEDVLQTNDLIINIKELIKVRKEEAGLNQQLADRAKQGQIEAEAKVKAEAEAEKKRLEAEKKRIDDMIKNKELAEENAKIAKENAELLNKLDEDRLAVSERISAIKESNNQLELNSKKETAEAHFKYDQLVYKSQVEQLEAIVIDESRSVEARKKANEELFILKIKNAEAIKDYEMKMLQYQTEAEIMENDKRVNAVEKYRESIIKAYKESSEAIKNSQLKNKKEEQDRLDNELIGRMDALDYMQDRNDKSFRAIEARGELAAKNIDQDFKNALGTEVPYKVKADIELELNDLLSDDSTSIFNGLIKQYGELKTALSDSKFGEESKKKIEKELDKVKMTIASEIGSITKSTLSTAFKYISSDVEIMVGEVVDDVGSLVAGIGESAGNVYLKVIGEAVSGLGKYFTLLESQNKKSEEKLKRDKVINENISKGLDITIKKTEEWLELLGQIDTSNLSLKELEDQLSNTYKQLSEQLEKHGIKLTSNEIATAISSSTSGDRYQAVKSAQEGKTYQQYFDEAKQRTAQTKDRIYTEEEYNIAAKIGKGEGMKNVGHLIDIETLLYRYAEPAGKIRQQIAQYDNTQGIDYTKSTTKEDFLTDINTMKDTGIISESQYYKDLYEYAAGIKSHPNDIWKWFRTDEVAMYKKQYDDFLKGGINTATSGIIGLANGGIVMGPTFATIAESGTPEAVVPLDRLPEIAAMFNRNQNGGIGQIFIENKIDPNIPITQESARYYSEQIGEAVRKTLRARGK